MSATATHDVVLNGVGYLVKPGSYRKRSAPLMGARFTTGNPDYSVLGPMQHWVQSCWVGGMDQDVWNDDAMFDEAVGLDTTVMERVQLSRDLMQGTAGGWAVDAARIPRQFVVYRNVLYLVTAPLSGSGQVWQWNASTSVWSLIKTLTGSLPLCGGVVWQDKLFIGGSLGMHCFDGTTWILFDGVQSGVGPDGTFGYMTGDRIRSMAAYGDRLYVSFYRMRTVWRLKSDLTWDGSTVFFQCPDAYISKMETHLGYLYMMSLSGTIFRTDGNNTGEVWRADPGAAAGAMRSYDGRLFIMLAVTDEGGTQCESAIYQLSGSAMTELKRWGRADKFVSYAGSMVVLGARMYYGASGLLGMADGFGIAVYDSAEDAHSIFASSQDSTSYPDVTGGGVGWTVDDMCLYGGRMFIAERDYGVFATSVTFKDYAAGRETALYDVSGGIYGGGWLKSSVYDAGTPGLLKLWASATLDLEIPATGGEVHLDLSVDGGTNWISDVSSVAYSVPGRRRVRVPILGDLRSPSVQYRLRLLSTVSSSTPVVYAIVIGYLPLPDPQWQWEMTFVLSEMQELLDGTTVTVDPGAGVAALEVLYRAMDLVSFTDIDGSTWSDGAIFTDLSEVVYLTGGPTEAEVRVVLLEAIEN